MAAMFVSLAEGNQDARAFGNLQLHEFCTNFQQEIETRLKSYGHSKQQVRRCLQRIASDAVAPLFSLDTSTLYNGYRVILGV